MYMHYTDILYVCGYVCLSHTVTLLFVLSRQVYNGLVCFLRLLPVSLCLMIDTLSASLPGYPPVSLAIRHPPVSLAIRQSPLLSASLPCYPPIALAIRQSPLLCWWRVGLGWQPVHVVSETVSVTLAHSRLHFLWNSQRIMTMKVAASPRCQWDCECHIGTYQAALLVKLLADYGMKMKFVS